MQRETGVKEKGLWECGGFSATQLRELAARVGTPFYAYNGEAIRGSFAALRSALPDGFEILYSMKANPHPEVLSLLRELGAGVDVASLRELERALAVGFTPEQISFVGPGKSAQELAMIVEKKLFSVVVESLAELRQIAELAAKAQQTVSVCIRVNPQRYLHPSGRTLKGEPSQFGMDEELLPEVLKLRQPSLNITGLHFFVRSHYLKAAHLVKNFTQFLDLAADFQHRLETPLRVVNLGGGFGIPYYPDQSVLDLGELRQGMTQLWGVIAQNFPQTRFFVESGRFIAGPGGVFVSRLLYRKSSRGINYLVCDGGMTQHLAASGLGFDFMGRKFPLHWLPHTVGRARPELETVTLIGPSSYGADIIGGEVELPRAQAGDLICIGQAGAYGFTFSPRRFIGLSPAREVFISKKILPLG